MGIHFNSLATFLQFKIFSDWAKTKKKKNCRPNRKKTSEIIYKPEDLDYVIAK